MKAQIDSELGQQRRLELISGLEQLGIDSDPTTVDQLLSYMQLLSKWNRVYNLTAIRDEQSMISHHLLDSIAVLPALQGERIVDVGAGAGLPGIVLAIMDKDRRFYELESNNKKARFMHQVVVELALKNVTVLCQRAEQPYFESGQPPGHESGFDTVLSRAFSSLPEMLNIAGHLCRPGGVILAMKGKIPVSELNSLPKGYFCDELEELKVPGLEAERHLVHIKLEDQACPSGENNNK